VARPGSVDPTVSREVRHPRHVALLWAVSARWRALVAGGFGAVAGIVAAFFTPWQLSTLIGWDVAAVASVVWVAATAGRFDARRTREYAIREDNSRASAQILLLGACLASLLGVAAALLKASQSQTANRGVLIGFAVFTVIASWAVVHMVFALRYAHLYYREPVGGIDFKSGREYEPDYRDFAYVAFTVGMTFQVSDTDIGARAMRRTVLVHSLLAYLFGAVILAVLINVVAALLQ
jgi:uncharacterized membrane protein